MNEIEMEISL